MNKSKLVQATIRARKNARNIGVSLLPGSKCDIINMNTMSLPRITKDEAIKLARDVTEYKHAWSVLLFVCGRCPVNGSYWKTLDIAPGGKCYSTQIDDACRSYHEQMVKDFNTNHFVSIGWLATPNDKPFDNDKLYDMFMGMGAWDYLAKWEQPGLKEILEAI